MKISNTSNFVLNTEAGSLEPGTSIDVKKKQAKRLMKNKTFCNWRKLGYVEVEGEAEAEAEVEVEDEVEELDVQETEEQEKERLVAFLKSKGESVTMRKGVDKLRKLAEKYGKE